MIQDQTFIIIIANVNQIFQKNFLKSFFLINSKYKNARKKFF